MRLGRRGRAASQDEGEPDDYASHGFTAFPTLRRRTGPNCWRVVTLRRSKSQALLHDGAPMTGELCHALDKATQSEHGAAISRLALGSWPSSCCPHAGRACSNPCDQPWRRPSMAASRRSGGAATSRTNVPVKIAPCIVVRLRPYPLESCLGGVFRWFRFL